MQDQVSPPLGRSRVRLGVGYVGPLPEGLVAVLREAYTKGFSVASNFTRQHDTDVAFAASNGWISTIDHSGSGYGRTWRITLEGHAKLLFLSNQGKAP